MGHRPSTPDEPTISREVAPDGGSPPSDIPEVATHAELLRDVEAVDQLLGEIDGVQKGRRRSLLLLIAVTLGAVVGWAQASWSFMALDFMSLLLTSAFLAQGFSFVANDIGARQKLRNLSQDLDRLEG